jgi:hypothetical protein
MSAMSNLGDESEIVAPSCACPIVQQTQWSFSVFCVALPIRRFLPENLSRRQLGDAARKISKSVLTLARSAIGCHGYFSTLAVPEHPLGEALLYRWLWGKPAHLDKSASAFGC